MTTDQKTGESSLERFERLAEEFRKSTGMMAPGKDSPLNDPGEHTWQERSTAWTWWCRGYGCAERNAGEGEKRSEDETDYEWEWMNAHRCLDELGAPRGKGADGPLFSLAGRIHALTGTHPSMDLLRQMIEKPPTTAARRED